MFWDTMDFLHEIIEGRMKGKPTRGRRRIQMLHDLANDGGFVALKRAAEDREVRRHRERLAKTCCTAEDYWWWWLLFIRATFCVDVSFCLYVLCLLAVLIKLSVPAKWLARKTPLRKPLLVRRLSPQSPGRRVLMTFCIFMCYFIVLLCVLSCALALHSIFHAPMAWYRLSVPNVPVHTNQPTQLSPSQPISSQNFPGLAHFKPTKFSACPGPAHPAGKISAN